jgi:(1->4)-alpha-D-glucan 1-alpha-D-glucosylmutase
MNNDHDIQAPAASVVPRATVRLQLHADFDFDAAAATVPYHRDLGISHLYLSPILQATQGSTHGYDCTDPGRVSPALGGRAGFERLVAQARCHGMGVIIDIVPNHLATHLDNPWWRDVLVHGRRSRYADYFDIDWRPRDPALHDRVLLPWLDGDLAQTFAKGDLRLGWQSDTGEFVVHAGGLDLPLGAASYGRLLAGSAPALAERFESSGHAAGSGEFEQARRALGAWFAGEGAPALERLLRAHDSGDAASHDRLRRLLDAQPWLLDDWRNAGRRINWRRFFDVGGLIAMRTEAEQVFEDMHREVFALYAEGLIDGVRIDHIDGLAAPSAYLDRLTHRLAELAPQRPAGAPPGPAYVVVEKILAAGEQLPRHWPVAGSTGYDFMAQVDGLLHRAGGAPALTALWREHGGEASFEEEAWQGKRDVLASTLAADAERAIDALHAIVPDAALDDVAAAVTELVVHTDVYRTYLGEAEAASLEDRQVLARAMAEAAAHGRPHDRALLARLVARMLGDDRDGVDAGARQLAIRRLQQLMTVSAAKGIEDTAFYRYGRLLSRNEVGAEPGQLAMSVAAFHRACVHRAADQPHGLLGTATHDHKRGEDVRARLAVLSSRTADWSVAVHDWRDRNQAHRRDDAPHPADELMLYQMLVGAWPLELAAGDREGAEAFVERIAGWQRKALREGKRRSSWIAPDTAYEEDCERFLRDVMGDAVFRAAVAAFADAIAAEGAVKSLARTALRLTVPGVPDLYQGTELWDFSLVDPDNRAAVDYARRREAMAGSDDDAMLMREWRDGRVKQRLIARLLAARAREPALFGSGDYQPLAVAGDDDDSCIAFARSAGNRRLIVVACVQPPAAATGIVPIDAAAFASMSVGLPAAGGWHEVVSQREVGGGTLHLRDLLGPWPVAVLLSR